MLSKNRLLDVLFVLVCLAILGTVVSRYREGGAALSVARGFQVKDDVRQLVPAGQSYRQVLLVIVHSQCQFCTSSMPFYKRLQAQLGPCLDTPIIFVSREPEATTKTYLESHGLKAAKINSVPLSALNGAGYPTLLVADRDGFVMSIWRGKLNEATENQVADAVRCQARSGI